MKIILDDTKIRQFLYPFTQTRSAADIRIGILTIKEKWEKILGYPVYTNARDIPLTNASAGDASLPVTLGGNIVPSKQWLEGLLKMNDWQPYFEEKDNVKLLNGPADIFKFNDWALRNDFELITKGRKSQDISSTNKVINPEGIFIEEGAKVEHSILNASTGPVYIGKNAEIMEGAMIRGPFALCEGAVVKMGSKIYGATTIGPFCNVAGEIKNAVLFGYSNKAHDGYLGDSVIGEWCNLGAGTTNSNVKNTAGEVLLWNNADNKYSVAGNKCGLLMGDYSRSAINTAFNTGTVVGVCCNIFGAGFPPKFIPDFTWGNESYQLEKALNDIDNWKRLKGKTITEQEKQILSDLYKTKNK